MQLLRTQLGIGRSVISHTVIPSDSDTELGKGFEGFVGYNTYLPRLVRSYEAGSKLQPCIALAEGSVNTVLGVEG